MIVNTESTDKESYEEFKIPEILKYSKQNFGNNAFTGSWDLKLTQKDVGTMGEWAPVKCPAKWRKLIKGDITNFGQNGRGGILFHNFWFYLVPSIYSR